MFGSEIGKIFVVSIQIGFVIRSDLTINEGEDIWFVRLNISDFQRKRNDQSNLSNKELEYLSGESFGRVVIGNEI